ncbi:MAG: metallophosphoesterase family protein [Deltaproteobacteria bacterium]|nr:metallophosphoesterase family protein [Deltaproteobacteria bacterium]
MRVAVLSDIHANIEAFQSVLHDLEDRADRILNLGDLVGYNASPNECVDLVRNIGMHSIQGNHDQAMCDLKLVEGFNIYAKLAVLWTRTVLNEENTRFLCGLAETSHISSGPAFHGSPESTSSYIGLHFQARSVLKRMKKGVLGKGNVCLYGHTHKQKIWRMDVRGKVAPVDIPSDGIVRLNKEEFYLLNPGSVGQPRNGDPRSSYLVLDTDEGTVRFRLVEYDISTTMGKVVDAGLPEFFATRLMEGT